MLYFYNTLLVVQKIHLIYNSSYSDKQGAKMFETCVDQLVKVTLTNEPVKTEWFNGTLFVSNITESQARQVFHRLAETLGLGKVMVHPIGDTGEFAYDFV